MSCASTCATRDHSSYGECLRAKRLTTLAGETTGPSFPPPKESK